MRPCAALGVLLAVACGASLACEPVVGQTGLVVELKADGPVDCFSLEVKKPGGAAVVARIDAPAAKADWRHAVSKALVYGGGALGDGAVQLAVTGHRRGCETPAVAKGSAEASFSRGTVKRVPIRLALLAADGDGDGFADGDDCHPGDEFIHPRDGDEAARECDGVDNDCDGEVDEGCPCDAPRPCHPLGLNHPSAGAGACVLGVRACTAGRLGACEGAVLPGPERCDGLDTDCDGRADPDSCPCAEGAERECYAAGPASAAGRGACVKGRERCESDGFFGPCLGDVAPVRERCNGVDDDCNGVVDDPDSIELPLCDRQEGLCAGARRACFAGQPASDCSGSDYQRAAAARGLTYVTDEGAAHCNGVDDDCDGDIDEGCDCTPGAIEPCHPLGGARPESATGACVRGRRACSARGTWGECTGAQGPYAESCDGVDDDCDGTADDGVPGDGEACDTSLSGVCGPGRRACVAGRMTCVSMTPASEELCDGRDDDCDGEVDDGFDKQNDPAHCGGPLTCTTCAAGSLCCGGRCTEVATDLLHCGACGAACTGDDACCGGGCADLATDPLHCGRCGHACAAGEVCRGSTCVPPAEPDCANGADDDNDGAKDCADDDCAPETACERGPAGAVVRVCRQGTCIAPREASCRDAADDDLDGARDCADGDCPAGTACDGTGGTCCGSGAAAACAHETLCSNGGDDDCDGLVDCRDPDCGCPGGQTCCGTVCRNLAADAANCGECGRGCGDGNACTADRCVSGRCENPAEAQRAQPQGCAGANVCCGGSCVTGSEVGGACVDGLDNDCDGAKDCGDGDCPCAVGTTCCGDACRNLATDLANCGACGTACTGATACTVATCTDAGCAYPPAANHTSCGSGLWCCAGGCTGATETLCGNGTDDDCDGLTDCGDPDCANKGPAERCNGVDDDCDTLADEDYTLGTACTAGDGVCRTSGSMVCTADGTGTRCSASADTSKQTTEKCNALDDDCDGTTDDGFTGLGTACTAGTGVCARTGTLVCKADGTATECSVTPDTSKVARETCNTKDDDCDGAVDERPACGGPDVDAAESVLTTWTVGESNDDNIQPCNPVARGLVALAEATVHLKVGKAVRVDYGPGGAAYFQAVYPKTRDANWDLSTRDRLFFWLDAHQPASYGGWSPAGPTIVLCGAGGAYRVLAPATNVLPRTYGTYVGVQVPLAGGTGWTKTDSGAFSLGTVHSVEFHADPQRGSGTGSVVMWLDEVKFLSAGATAPGVD